MVNLGIETRPAGEYVKIDGVLSSVQREVLIEYLTNENDKNSQQMLVITKDNKVMYDYSKGINLNTIIIVCLVIMIIIIIIILITGQVNV